MGGGGEGWNFQVIYNPSVFFFIYALVRSKFCNGESIARILLQLYWLLISRETGSFYKFI